MQDNFLNNDNPSNQIGLIISRFSFILMYPFLQKNKKRPNNFVSLLVLFCEYPNTFIELII
jgi:hypothetical protein